MPGHHLPAAAEHQLGKRRFGRLVAQAADVQHQALRQGVLVARQLVHRQRWQVERGDGGFGEAVSRFSQSSVGMGGGR